MEYVSMGLGFLLILVSLWGMLTQKNIIKIIISFSVFDTGLHVIMVSIGYIKGKTAPIIDADLTAEAARNGIVDPVPQALVLTAIVIGLGVTALMLVYALKLYEKKKSLDITKYKELRW